MTERIHSQEGGTPVEHTIYDMRFRRRFSVDPYKTLKLKLGEMSFWKDWVNTDRGDPYPILFGDGALYEETANGRLSVQNTADRRSSLARLLGQHFPYATYEVTIAALENASVGFAIKVEAGERSTYTDENAPLLKIFLVRDGDGARICYELSVGKVSRGVTIGSELEPYTTGMSLIVTCRGRYFDVYLKNDKKPIPCLTIDIPELSGIIKHSNFVNSTASLWYELEPMGRFVADEVSFYLDAGVSQADMKPICYEDGIPIMEHGRVFMTMSSRAEAGGFQSVISWNPSTCDFKMEGAIFFDHGDDLWCADVASSILFDRSNGEWYIWATSFSHGHILCHGTSTADLRYGINVIDAVLMPTETKHEADVTNDTLAAQAGASSSVTAELSDDTLWLARSGDEDPDLVYDKECGLWYMTICRCIAENGGTYYRYFLFESERPFSGYRFVDRTRSGSNTGGLITRIGGKLHLICGSDFDKRACYHVYDLHDLSTYERLRCDHDDGGFRGWGTVFPVPCGARTRYIWMTFDRHCGSTYNWSYGNIYVYESDLMNTGYEHKIQYKL